MSASRGAATAAALAAALAVAGCAGSWAGRREAPAGDEGLGAWAALVDGRPADAQRLAAARLAVAPADEVALFTRATIAYERGDGPAALNDYAGLLVAAARDGGQGWGPLLAPVAAARALALDDDVPAGTRRGPEAALLALQGGDGAARLPWQARVELARLGDHVARRAGDPAELDRAAAAAGCARAVFEAGALGPLPHLDLDNWVGTPLRPTE